MAKTNAHNAPTRSATHALKLRLVKRPDITSAAFAKAVTRWFETLDLVKGSHARPVLWIRTQNALNASLRLLTSSLQPPADAQVELRWDCEASCADDLSLISAQEAMRAALKRSADFADLDHSSLSIFEDPNGAAALH